LKRAFRYATELQFDIEEQTYRGIEEMAARIEIMSKERVMEELIKIVLSPMRTVSFALLFYTGLLPYFLPDMLKLHCVAEVRGVRHKDNLWHTRKVLDNVDELGADLWLRGAAIVNDIAKPDTQEFVPGTGWTFHGHDASGAKWVKRIF